MYGEILRTLLNKPVQSERDVKTFALRIALFCLVIAILIDSVFQLLAFGGWLDVLRGWVIATCVVAAVAYPVGIYIGTTRLEHHRVKTKLIEQSLNDSLTGLRNRSALPVDFEATPATDRRLMLLSLDRFKAINESFGHLIGDRVLVRCARMIAEELGNLGPLYRTDGTEFTLLLSSGTPAEIKAQVLTLLTRVESSNFGTPEQPIHLTLSVGLADASAGFSFAQAFSAADTALESAKVSGRSRLWLGSEPTAAGIVEGDDIVWESEAPHAVRR